MFRLFRTDPPRVCTTLPDRVTRTDAFLIVWSFLSLAIASYLAVSMVQSSHGLSLRDPAAGEGCTPVFLRSFAILFNISRCIFRSIGFASRMDLREVFAANLRRLRHDKGLSQDDLAYEAEVSRSYLSQLEKGAFYASLKIVGKLAAVLQVEPAELLMESPKRKRR